MQLIESRIITEEGLENYNQEMINSDHFYRGKIERDMAQLGWMTETERYICDVHDTNTIHEN